MSRERSPPRYERRRTKKQYITKALKKNATILVPGVESRSGNEDNERLRQPSKQERSQLCSSTRFYSNQRNMIS